MAMLSSVPLELRHPGCVGNPLRRSVADELVALSKLEQEVSQRRDAEIERANAEAANILREANEEAIRVVTSARMQAQTDAIADIVAWTTTAVDAENIVFSRVRDRVIRIVIQTLESFFVNTNVLESLLRRALEQIGKRETNVGWRLVVGAAEVEAAREFLRNSGIGEEVTVSSHPSCNATEIKIECEFGSLRLDLKDAVRVVVQNLEAAFEKAMEAKHGSN